MNTSKTIFLLFVAIHSGALHATSPFDDELDTEVTVSDTNVARSAISHPGCHSALAWLRRPRFSLRTLLLVAPAAGAGLGQIGLQVQNHYYASIYSNKLPVLAAKGDLRGVEEAFKLGGALKPKAMNQALLTALSQRDPKVAAYLLDRFRQYRVELADGEVSERVFIKALESGDEKLLLDFWKGGRAMDFQSGRGLIELIENKQLDLALAAIDGGADIHFQNGRILQEAISYGDEVFLRALLERGADPTQDAVRLLADAKAKDLTSGTKLSIDLRNAIKTVEPKGFAEAAFAGRENFDAMLELVSLLDFRTPQEQAKLEDGLLAGVLNRRRIDYGRLGMMAFPLHGMDLSPVKKHFRHASKFPKEVALVVASQRGDHVARKLLEKLGADPVKASAIAAETYEDLEKMILKVGYRSSPGWGGAVDPVEPEFSF